MDQVEATDEQVNDRTTKEEKEDSQGLLQRFFVSRMERLLFVSQDPVDRWQRALLRRATYSTYLDCVETGVGDEARTLLGGAGSQQTRALVVQT